MTETASTAKKAKSDTSGAEETGTGICTEPAGSAPAKPSNPEPKPAR